MKSANRSVCASAALASRFSRVCAQQIVDQNLGMNFFLDVERRRVDDEVAPVLLVLAAPDELRIEIGVARILYRAWALLLLLNDGLILGRRNVLPLGLVVLERFDGFGVWRWISWP